MKYILSFLQQYAKNKNGSLITTEYINNSIKLLWNCSEGHEWRASWKDIHNKNTWCPTCNGFSKPHISILQQYATNKCGLLISTEYNNNKQKLDWQCEKGHQWKATWNNILSKNHWCKKCSGHAKPEIIKLKTVAAYKEGLLLSTEYIDSKSKLLWQCKEGHQWNASWNNILHGTWCPECASFKTEVLVKTLLEQKLNVAFKKTRFFYKGYRYEFDGYNEEHKIAFEYHGYQHYIYPNIWQKTRTLHNEAIQRDKNKESYCSENNIKLIIIPYTIKPIIEQYIADLPITL